MIVGRKIRPGLVLTDLEREERWRPCNKMFCTALNGQPHNLQCLPVGNAEHWLRMLTCLLAHLLVCLLVAWVASPHSYPKDWGACGAICGSTEPSIRSSVLVDPSTHPCFSLPAVHLSVRPFLLVRSSTRLSATLRGCSVASSHGIGICGAVAIKVGI